MVCNFQSLGFQFEYDISTELNPPIIYWSKTWITEKYHKRILERGWMDCLILLYTLSSGAIRRQWVYCPCLWRLCERYIRISWFWSKLEFWLVRRLGPAFEAPVNAVGRILVPPLFPIPLVPLLTWKRHECPLIIYAEDVVLLKALHKNAMHEISGQRGMVCSKKQI